MVPWGGSATLYEPHALRKRAKPSVSSPLGEKRRTCHFVAMPSWISSTPNLDRPIWYGRNLWWHGAALLSAFAALAAGRWQLRTILPRDISRANRASATNGRLANALSDDDRIVMDRLTRIIPRAARMCPFRSDCLVQALAGQDLLGRRTIASKIILAAQDGPLERFQPHALLLVGEVAVTGGDPSLYMSLYDDTDAEIQE